MAQQNINFGQYPDDINADAIRTAFEKVEQNFNDLYSGNNVSGVTKIIPGRGITLSGTTTGAGNVTISAQLYQVNLQSSTLQITGSPLTTGSGIIGIDFNNRDFQVGNLYASNFIGMGNASSNLPALTKVGNTIVIGGPNVNIDGAYISNLTLGIVGNVGEVTFIDNTGGANFISSNASFTFNKNSGTLGVTNATVTNAVSAAALTATAATAGTLTVTGNTTTQNISTTNNVTVGNSIILTDQTTSNSYLGNVLRANFFVGDGGFLSNLSASFSGNVNFANAVIISNTLPASSLTSGALQVFGGAGIGGSLFAFNIVSTTNILAQQGLSAVGNTTLSNLSANGTVTFTNTQDSFSRVTGALQVAGGIGVTGNVFANNLTTTNTATIGTYLTVNSVDANSALTVSAGGANIARNITAGGNVIINSGTTSTGFGTGALQVTGGISTGGNIWADLGNVTALNVFADVESEYTYANTLLYTKQLGIYNQNLNTQVLYGQTYFDPVVGVNIDQVVGSAAFTYTASTLTAPNIVASTNMRATNSLVVGGISSAGIGAGQMWASGSITAFHADLAEYYHSDEQYAPGTVLEFGGSAEVTIASTDMTTRVAGVVSTDPGYVLNGAIKDDKDIVALALQGRVPTKVIGYAHKGDLMVSAGNGRARAEAEPVTGSIIGKALEDKDYAEAGVIEVAVGRL